MNKEIAELIGEINIVSILINTETKHHVFISVQGHVNSITIKFWKDGWESYIDPTMRDEFYYAPDGEECIKEFDYEYSLKKLRGILDTLRKIYKNGKVNMKHFKYETEEIKHYKFK